MLHTIAEIGFGILFLVGAIFNASYTSTHGDEFDSSFAAGAFMPGAPSRVDRLARAVEDYAAITGALIGLGIRVRSAGKSLDDSPAGRLVENLLASVAQ